MLRSRILIVVSVNLTIVLSFGFGVLIFYKIGKPHIQGFYCNDNSIRKPFKESTIPAAAAVAVAMNITLVLVFVIEIRFLYLVCQMSEQITVKNNIWYLMKYVLILFVIYLYGAGINHFFTDIGKYTVGRLRPNFIAICQPDWFKVNCTDSHGLNNYIVGDQFCTVGKTAELKDARLSFPSGHTSFSIYSATFMVLFIEARLQLENRWQSIPKVFLQVVLMLLGVYCSLTRISDNKHHPTDVLAGAVLGAVTALGVFWAVVRGILNMVDADFSAVLKQTEALQ